MTAVLKVAVAVQADLDLLAQRNPALATSGLAAGALVLARKMDNPRTSATEASMCMRAMLETLDRLLELAPPAEENDDLDHLQARAALKLVG